MHDSDAGQASRPATTKILSLKHIYVKRYISFPLALDDL